MKDALPAMVNTAHHSSCKAPAEICTPKPENRDEHKFAVDKGSGASSRDVFSDGVCDGHEAEDGTHKVRERRIQRAGNWCDVCAYAFPNATVSRSARVVNARWRELW